MLKASQAKSVTATIMSLEQAHEDEKRVVEDETTSISTEDDIAAAILPDQAQVIDPRLERRVVRKIDFFLIPVMWIGYGFVYYDKVNR